MRIVGLALAIIVAVTMTLPAQARCYSGCNGYEYAHRVFLPWVMP